MNKKLITKIMLIMVIIFIIGDIFIFSSGSIGKRIAYQTLQKKGGTMGTELYNNIVNSITTNFRIFGSILSMFGVGGILLCFHNIFNKELHPD